MKSLGRTKLKKFNPRKNYLAPYIQFPWGYGKELIGKEIEIFETEDGFHIKILNSEFKQSEVNDLENRLQEIERKINDLTKGAQKQDGLVVIRTRDLRRVKATS